MTSGLGPATPQLLGALVNLAVARPTALVEMQHLGTLQVVIPLIDPEAYGGPLRGETDGRCVPSGSKPQDV